MAGKILIALLSLSLLAGCGLREKRIAKCIDKIDPAIERELVEPACSGNKMAQFMLGYLFETGEGAVADPKKAVAWYRRAARPTRGMSHVDMEGVEMQALGGVVPVQTGREIPANPDAEYRLGLMHLEGRGVEQSRDKAVRWFRGAAKKGHVQAAAALEELEAGTP